MSTQNIAVDFPLNPEIESESGIATRIVAYSLSGFRSKSDGYLLRLEG